MPRKRVPKTPKKAEKFCNTCSKNETCKVLCPAVEAHLRIDHVYQREFPVSFKGKEGRNPIGELLDIGRSHPIEGKWGDLQATNPFTLAELQAIFDSEYHFPFLFKIENKVLSLKWGEGKTWAQIAFHLNIQQGRAKAIYLIAKRKLRKALDEGHPFLEGLKKEREALQAKIEKNIKGYSKTDIQRFLKDEIAAIRDRYGGRSRPKVGAYIDKSGQDVQGESLGKSGKWRKKL